MTIAPPPERKNFDSEKIFKEAKKEWELLVKVSCRYGTKQAMNEMKKRLEFNTRMEKMNTSQLSIGFQS